VVVGCLVLIKIATVLPYEEGFAMARTKGQKRMILWRLTLGDVDVDVKWDERKRRRRRRERERGM
jgi:hypothetical protein